MLNRQIEPLEAEDTRLSEEARLNKTPTRQPDNDHNGHKADLGAHALSGDLGAIDQVRELLFGEQKRDHENRFDAVDRHFERLHAEINARFAALEARLAEHERDTHVQRLAGFDAIGQAIAQLGYSIKTMGSDKA